MTTEFAKFEGDVAEAMATPGASTSTFCFEFDISELIEDKADLAILDQRQKEESEIAEDVFGRLGM